MYVSHVTFHFGVSRFQNRPERRHSDCTRCTNQGRESKWDGQSLERFCPDPRAWKIVLTQSNITNETPVISVTSRIAFKWDTSDIHDITNCFQVRHQWYPWHHELLSSETPVISTRFFIIEDSLILKQIAWNLLAHGTYCTKSIKSRGHK